MPARAQLIDTKPAVPGGNWVELARDISQNILPLDQILASHGLDAVTWDRIRIDPQFDQLLRECIAEWNSAIATPDRIKMKAQAITEMALPIFHDAIHDTSIPLAQRTEAFKVVRALTGLGDRGDAPVAAITTALRIFIGGDKPVVIDGKAEPQGDVTQIDVR